MYKNFKLTKNKEIDEKVMKILPHVLGIFFIGDTIYRYFVIKEELSWLYIPSIIFAF